jgi:hypothetical protein
MLLGGRGGGELQFSEYHLVESDIEAHPAFHLVGTWSSAKVVGR